MSGIIWGYIDFNHKKINQNINTDIMKHMKRYKIDKFRSIQHSNILFGCGLQHITSESLQEKIPYEDDELLITADAIIDNRNELLEKLNLNEHNESDFSDSQYILMAYKKWGNDCCNYLIGDYAFVIWNKKKNELYCARDHVGKRTLYYCLIDNKFTFSTTIRPILDVINYPELNEEQLVEYLSIEGVLSSTNIKETIYKGIYKLEPSSYMIVNNSGCKINKYWDPGSNVKTLNLKSDREYEKKFIEVFSEAVKCRLRTNGKIGVMLSSGLDSGSVASVAALQLKNKNKYLYSYTSVPLKEFNYLKVEHRAIDESQGVKEILNKHHNIIPKFCDFRDENSLNRIEEYMEMLEMPYKAIENIYWYTGIAKSAAGDGCRVLLDGQFGNSTISYGEYYINLMTLIKKMDIKGIIKENKGLRNLYHLSKKECFENTFKLLIPYWIREKIFNIKYKDLNSFKLSPVKNELKEKWDIEKILKTKKLGLYITPYLDWNQTRKMIVNPITLSHVAEYETKVSLNTGILKRDPTRDKRVIELILSYPISQFVKEGVERNLIKRAMKGLIPDDLLEGKIKRGIQGADWLERLREKWDDIYKDIQDSLDNSNCMRFFDMEKVNSYLDEFKQLPIEYGENEKYKVRALLSTYIFCKFMKNICNKLNVEV